MCVMFSCDNSSQPPVFKAGDDLALAIADLKSGETLYVTDDVDLDAPITIPAGKAVVIQLTGDSEIEYEGSGSAFVVEDGGSLVIKGPVSGSGKSMKDGAAGGTVIEANEPVEALFKVGPGATLELENVTLIGENKPYCGLILINNPAEELNGPVIKLTDVRAVASKSVITSYAHGEANDLCSNEGCTHWAYATVEIKGGYFEKTSNDAYFGNENCIYLIACKGLIEGAEVVSRNGACIEVACSDRSGEAIKIKDCTVTSNYGGDAHWQGTAVAASLKGEIEIEGGTYTGHYALATYNGIYTPDGTITCTGATLRGSEADVSKTGGDGFISVDGTDY